MCDIENDTTVMEDYLKLLAHFQMQYDSVSKGISCMKDKTAYAKAVLLTLKSNVQQLRDRVHANNMDYYVAMANITAFCEMLERQRDCMKEFIQCMDATLDHLQLHHGIIPCGVMSDSDASQPQSSNNSNISDSMDSDNSSDHPDRD